MRCLSNSFRNTAIMLVLKAYYNFSIEYFKRLLKSCLARVMLVVAGFSLCARHYIPHTPSQSPYPSLKSNKCYAKYSSSHSKQHAVVDVVRAKNENEKKKHKSLLFFPFGIT